LQQVARTPVDRRGREQHHVVGLAVPDLLGAIGDRVEKIVGLIDGQDLRPGHGQLLIARTRRGHPAQQSM
jgi:hypothetical protein